MVRDPMTEKVFCPMPTCGWQWRHRPEETEQAMEMLAGHSDKDCLIVRPCSHCGARPGEACHTKASVTTHRPHNARRRMR